MGGTSLPAGCQMFTSASVQTEGLGSGFLSADAVLNGGSPSFWGPFLQREAEDPLTLHPRTHTHQEAAQSLVT